MSYMKNVMDESICQKALSAWFATNKTPPSASDQAQCLASACKGGEDILSAIYKFNRCTCCAGIWCPPGKKCSDYGSGGSGGGGILQYWWVGAVILGFLFLGKGE